MRIALLHGRFGTGFVITSAGLLAPLLGVREQGGIQMGANHHSPVPDKGTQE